MKIRNIIKYKKLTCRYVKAVDGRQNWETAPALTPARLFSTQSCI